VVSVWRDNEVHSKSVEKQIIGYEEDAEETHHEETEYQEEGDVIPNVVIYYDNGDPGGLGSEYEYENDNEMTEDDVLKTVDTTGYAGIILKDYLLQ